MENTELRDEFLKYSTKFLFINCNYTKKDYNVEELNSLLNELNGLDYKSGKIIEPAPAVRMIQSLLNIPIEEETLVVKSCCLLVSLVKIQKIIIPLNTFNSIVKWLMSALETNFSSIACEVLAALKVLFKENPMNIKKFYESLISPNGLLIKTLKTPPSIKQRKGSYETNTIEDITISIIYCIEAILIVPDDITEKTDIPDSYLETVGNLVLNVIFSAELEKYGETNYCNLITSLLNICRIISNFNKNWSGEKLGEILGATKSFIMFGIPGIKHTIPQKVLISQQAVSDQQSCPINNSNKGGKVAKTRKPRTNNSKTKKIELKKNTPTTVTAIEDNRQPYSGNSITFVEQFYPKVMSYRTSDSDFSESEVKRIQNDRRKEVKLRQSALTLVATLAKITEKRILFGYWHSLFPTETNTPPTTVSLLNCVLRDPSPRCRMTALQATSILLYGSKPFLSQAETSDKTPSTFMPFSMALGNMITTFYTILTQALSGEGSLPVLTQILKCFTVLIQSTPFHRLQKGLVTSFVKYIRRLIYHKDPTIQVAALMVIGFLISVTPITPEISEVVGIPKSNYTTNKSDIHNTGANELIETEYDENDLIDSEHEDEIEEEKVKATTSDILPSSSSTTTSKMSWLLQITLENLGIKISEFKTKKSLVTTPVRIESLQVLSAMGPHFLLLKDNLVLISKALEYCFFDQLPEIRLYAGRCLDTIGNAMNIYLLEQGSLNQDDMKVFLQFWVSILPSVTNQIQDQTQSSSLKAVCCDSLANIGVHVFERFPRDKQIVLISLLSGSCCDEEITVRAAAIRALAVYVLFPSLREDLCYVENTAESIIRLMQEQNFHVRIKASWSLGNISDALITNSSDSGIERINDELLKRLLEVSLNASNDNDKVRSNVMRAIGNFLRIFNKNHFSIQVWNDLFLEALEKMKINGINKGNMKVKWNTCYAIGNIMKNTEIYEMKNCANWQSIVFEALCNIIITCVNFKVRINGVIALTQCTERKQYGMYFIKIWSSFLSALEQSEHLTDFNEYKHRDNLVDQLCYSLAHFINLSNKDDLILMNNELLPLVDLIKQNWFRVTNRVLPEKSVSLLSACIKLKEYNLDELTSQQKLSVVTLKTCFVLPLTEYV